MKCKGTQVEANSTEEEKGNGEDIDKEQKAIPELADDIDDEFRYAKLHIW